jgi:hypothetical protein
VRYTSVLLGKREKGKGKKQYPIALKIAMTANSGELLPMRCSLSTIGIGAIGLAMTKN